MRRINWLVLFLVFLAGCSQAPQSGECDPHVVYSQEPNGHLLLDIDPKNCLATATAGGPTSTIAPATVTPISAATATATIPIPQPVLANPGFETKAPFGHVSPRYGLPEINVVQGWQPYFCAMPYTPSDCATPAQWNPNPYTTYQKRPEYKPANPDQDCVGVNQYANRVQKGCQAQQFFAFYGVMNAGVYQTVTNLIPGVTYEFSVSIQLWSAENAIGGCVKRDAQNRCIEHNADAYTSDIASEDDRHAINARVGVDTACGSYAYTPAVTWSSDYSYTEGFYDHYGTAKIRFTATGTCATLYAGGYNRYGKAHNDIYLDNAKLVVAP